MADKFETQFQTLLKRIAEEFKKCSSLEDLETLKENLEKEIESAKESSGLTDEEKQKLENAVSKEDLESVKEELEKKVESLDTYIYTEGLDLDECKEYARYHVPEETVNLPDSGSFFVDVDVSNFDTATIRQIATKIGLKDTYVRWYCAHDVEIGDGTFFVGGNLNLTGELKIDGSVEVTGDVTGDGSITATGSVRIRGSSEVAVYESTTINSPHFIVDNGTVTFYGDVSFVDGVLSLTTTSGYAVENTANLTVYCELNLGGGETGFYNKGTVTVAAGGAISAEGSYYGLDNEKGTVTVEAGGKIIGNSNEEQGCGVENLAGTVSVLSGGEMRATSTGVESYGFYSTGTDSFIGTLFASGVSYGVYNVYSTMVFSGNAIIIGEARGVYSGTDSIVTIEPSGVINITVGANSGYGIYAVGEVILDGTAYVTANQNYAVYGAISGSGTLYVNDVVTTFSSMADYSVNATEIDDESKVRKQYSSQTLSTTNTFVGWTAWEQIGGASDDSKINILGDRTRLAGYEVVGAASVINQDSPDANEVGEPVTVENGITGTCWTKIVRVTSAVSITLGSSWKWQGGNVPDIASGGILVLCWCGSGGLAQFNSPE